VQDANDATSANYGQTANLLAPYSGGQNFDAEFLGIAQSGSKLYVSIMTGQRPDNATENGFSTYEPGDLKIVAVNSKGTITNGTVFGVELGKSSAAGFGNGNIGTTSGTTFNLTTSSTPGAGGVAGLVASETTTSWKVGQILKGATFASGVLGTEATQITGGTGHGAVEQLIETGTTVSNQHQVFEMVIDLKDLLGITDDNDLAGNSLSFEWGPGCGNDLIASILTSGQGDIRTPEPAGLALFGLGMLGLGFVRRRKAA
jgi:hypothetical protein